MPSISYKIKLWLSILSTEEIRVLIIDDSKVISSGIKQIIETDERITVVGVAYNGKEGYQEILRLNPDITLLDINMPVMDGLSLLLFLQKQKRQDRIIVLSTLTSEGSRSTIRALNLGAVDFLYKPEDSINSIKDELIEKIVTIHTSHMFWSDSDEMDMPIAISEKEKKTEQKKEEIKKEEHQNLEKTSVYKELSDEKRAERRERIRSSFVPVVPKSQAKDKHKLPPIPNGCVEPKLIAIGISTGGPKALNEIIPTIPADFPLPILIVQHMPEIFTKQLANSLNNISNLEVREASDEEVTKPSTVYIAPGKKHMSVSYNATGDIVIKTIPDNGNYTHTPSVDHFFYSIKNNLSSRALAVLMTGMGRDGADGLAKLNEKNALTIAQDESTSSVFGMPRVAIEMKAAKVVLPLEDIVPFILKVLGR